MAGAESPDGLLSWATPLLRERWGARLTLDAPTLIREGPRNRVFRCRVRGADAPTSSVVLKQLTDDAGLGFADWACLSFLTDRPGAEGLAPRFYVGDRTRRFFLMEDLGGSRSLRDVLAGSDRAAAEEALTALATRTARLHGATLGHEDNWRRHCRALPEAVVCERRADAAQWRRRSREAFRAWLAAVGCPAGEAWMECLPAVADVYAAPGPFLALTHGDPAPTNNHCAGADVRLLDFEYGGFRHALYDITAWHVLCPLPDSVVSRMSAAYRTRSSRGRARRRVTAGDTGRHGLSSAPTGPSPC